MFVLFDWLVVVNVGVGGVFLLLFFSERNVDVKGLSS